ncbi:unnamed protein product [Closterium sp. NIES-65]|nr:unnamed protein product [Closterium sp. NIES-65]
MIAGNAILPVNQTPTSGPFQELTHIKLFSINKQTAAGRKPANPLPEGLPSPGATSYEAPRDVLTRGRRDANRVASSRVVDNYAHDNDDDDDSDYNEYAVGTDDEADSREEPDKGMYDSEDDDESDESEDAPEETQPAALTTRAGVLSPQPVLPPPRRVANLRAALQRPATRYL